MSNVMGKSGERISGLKTPIGKGSLNA